jgi:imidazolonepropionase-like amidohydrolase
MKILLLAILFSCICSSLFAHVLAITGAKIYASPADAPIENGIILIEDGRILALGPIDAVKIPEGAETLKCDGMFITAGFQNSHVHLTESKWEEAKKQSAENLNTALSEMFLRYGFTTVVDTGSSLENTLAIRSRIEAGELNGPKIITAGSPIYPENGIPYYLKESLPPAILPLLATPATPEAAKSVVQERINSGVDIVKIFTGSWVARGKVLNMPVEIASSIAGEAHEKGKPVFAHASNVKGLEIALDSGVDVLAHALDDDRGWNASHISRMKAANMAMIPTLKLFFGPSFFKYILKEVADFSTAGGEILFGTDVGFMTDYDPAQEYELMGEAGMTWKQILASLTTSPAGRFQESKVRGRIAAGLAADFVVLGTDPAIDAKAFSDVRYTIRAGNIVYKRSQTPSK